MIPKKIHYCWFGGSDLPKDVLDCKKSWTKYCPDYEIIEWNESNFDINSHPFMKKAYEAKAWAFVSDLARLLIIYNEGGIYLDTDVELIQPLDLILSDKSFFAVQQHNNYVASGLGFGAEKNSIVVKQMINEYESLDFDINNIKQYVCPILNTKALEKFGYKPSDEIQKLEVATVYPPRFFDPYSSSANAEDLMTDETISIHHYSASWTTSKQKLKRKIAKKIGFKTVNKIKKFLKLFK